MRESQDSSATAVASFTWWSILYNFIFVLNLASTSFMAYLNEPRPGQTTDQHLPQWNSFDESVRTTASFLQRVHSNLSRNQSLFQRDLATNTFAMHRDLTIPSSIHVHNTFEYIVQMPFAIYYGDGMQTYVAKLASTRETDPAHALA
ncbi:hypothetical protein LEN26_012165 [Aphanomyces euteiches]|nr:hypothetical protein AeMF1_020451 [Aphanomyces euteiches]KAH9118351.1 hypothetical protein LEN26_012165 [Aphanomyces euteiches]KAH9166473.1 hypothetical protein AeNC1_018327 [Aphanomyces euteiches]